MFAMDYKSTTHKVQFQKAYTMCVFDKFIFFGCFAIVFSYVSRLKILIPILCSVILQIILCGADNAHDKMVNSTIREYLREYKQRIVKTETNITKQLNQVALSTERMFHQYVQNTSILYDFDNKDVNRCVQNEILQFNK